MKERKIKLGLILFISFLYMEMVYKIFLMPKIFRISLINMILFISFFSLILNIITNMFKNTKVNKIIFFTILFIICTWFSASYVLKSYFDITLSLDSFALADQVASFAFKGLIEILRRIFVIILLFMPFILTLIFQKYLYFERNNKKINIILIILMLISYLLYFTSLRINKNKSYSSYELYYKINDVSLNVDNFGVINTFFIDVKRKIFGFEEELVLDIEPIENDKNDNNNHEEEKVYDYNILDLNFNDSNDTIKKINDYIRNDEGTLQNEYTGIFKDKNLILFMAESFNEIAVREDITPTLNKLVNSGFVFDNFYTPAIYSTIGGEFQELTGLYPYSTGILFKFRSGNIAFPQGIANKFSAINYNTYAYHNNTYTFQDRNKYLKSIGFTNFKACGNGFENQINCKVWPRSDLEMVEKSFNEYSNDDKFMVFYASNSGHSPYDSLNANGMARKNKEEYLSYNLPYSKRAASYLASQMELDKALEYLINKLEEKGILDDTVIALVGDHYPYELNLDEINEMSTFERNEEVTVNKSSFILWNSELETTHVDKVGSQIDVIPTIYNAFGISYDSRLFMGRDILSNAMGLAMFANRSWVTDKGTYYASSHKFVPTGDDVDSDYIKSINSLVNNKITMSKLIIENNYYKDLFN